MKRKRLIAAVIALLVLLVLLAVSVSCDRRSGDESSTAEGTVPAAPAATLDGSEFEHDNDGLYRPEW